MIFFCTLRKIEAIFGIVTEVINRILFENYVHGVIVDIVRNRD